MNAQLLLVEDDVLIRASLSKALASEGWLVFAVSHQDSLDEALREAPFDLVLFDLDSTSGTAKCWAAAGQFIADLPQLPFVLFTAQTGQRHRADQVGASVLLEKPLNLLQLIETIGQLIEWRRRQPPLGADSAPRKMVART